jgi:hypothetical protein
MVAREEVKKSLGTFYQKGKITKNNNDGTYDVLINGQTSAINGRGYIYSINDVVQICTPNGNLVDRYIDSVDYSTFANIVEEGDSGIWHYWKYSNGWAKCLGVVNITTTINWAWGNEYYKPIDRIRYPFEFIDVPLVFYSVDSDDPAGCKPQGAGTVSQIPLLWLTRAQAAGSDNLYKINLKIEGKWQ